MIQYSLPSV